MLSYYREKYDLKPHYFPMAQAANDCSISSLFHGMTDSEQQYVVDVICSSNPQCVV